MLRVTSLQFSFGKSEPLFARVNLEFQAGEFALVCGPTGSGKSTLLRTLNGLAPHFTGGQLSGKIEIDSQDVTGWQPHALAGLVGFVNQQPEGAFVTDTVEEELVYGMEQLGFDPAVMRERVADLAAKLGLDQILNQQLTELSGGQQQRVAIAAALSAEHRLERALPSVDSMVIVHGDGSVTKQKPDEAIREFRLVPPVVELSNRLGLAPAALSTRDQRFASVAHPRFEPTEIRQPAEYVGQAAISVTGLSVAYGSKPAVSDVSLKVERGQVLALMGENGTGKTSLLWAMQGSLERSAGSVETPWGDTRDMTADERLCAAVLVPQKASDLLFLPTVAAELQDSDRFAKAAETTTATLFQSFAGRVDPSIHPRDLSAGQQLALVLAIQLAKGAGILLLDEPTRGLDYSAKRALAAIIAGLRDRGKAVIVATHDIEFAALIATDVALLNEGRVVARGMPVEIFGVGGELPSEVSLALKQPGLFALEQLS